jgi:hypothetical protein
MLRLLPFQRRRCSIIVWPCRSAWSVALQATFFFEFQHVFFESSFGIAKVRCGNGKLLLRIS